MKNKSSPANVWSAEEKAILDKIIRQFDGSPSRAYRAHPDWKEKLSAHTPAAMYAKINYLKGKGAKTKAGQPQQAQEPGTALIPVKVSPNPPKQPRFVVIADGALEAITCPKCNHQFNVMERP